MSKETGYINAFNDFKGFGFIRREKGKDVYFSIDDFETEVEFEAVSVGLQVAFLVKKEAKGPKAFCIEFS
ncbi:cold-shock protein [Vibrio splendidus]|uniref:CSD domain-containing protein n=3 Tax=Vibrionaceae TaxID=641 RepID=A0A0H3ZWZ8_9VIBR|nr:retron Se72 family effector protein [Vibrio splendidus]AKN36265.1 hypothetical protein [Enterovibrio norvegicus]AKN36631.1 hypothetical protein [Vibrio tasmaniensis]AKN36828.1 hypothetical protein [Vibrio sp. 1F_148]AKN38006.1 hypothetical protein [Vibrio tasmaniensis]PTP81600.1 cold-shock protein [Vibrio splendidus]